MRCLVLSLSVVLLASSPAMAGMCEGESAVAMVKELELYARRGKPKPFVNHLCMETAQQLPKLVKRTLAACTTILERDPKDAECVEWSARFGAKRLGTIDLFERVAETHALQPFADRAGALPVYEALADPRALPLITAAWTAALADPRSKQPRHAYDWLVWRHAAIKIFAQLGGVTERAFLEPELAAAKDRGLRKALRKAIEAIDQRAKAPGKPAP